MVVNYTKLILVHGLLLCLLLSTRTDGCKRDTDDEFNNFTQLEKELKDYVDETLSRDTYNIMDGVSIRRIETKNDSVLEEQCEENGRSAVSTFEEYVLNKLDKYSRTHILTIQAPQKGRFFKVATGKSSFLTGFGLGFLAFGLKKLLLPMFIGAQIMKSVLIAMFLPSILGTVGKLVGKGISHASSLSGSSNHQPAPIDDFDFKDTGTPYNAEGTQDEYAAVAVPDFNFQPTTTTSSSIAQQAMNRFGNEGYYQKHQKMSYSNTQSDNYYLRRPNKQHDYKVFHKIPSSSLLLTTYDPFYSPLLSRLDAVFQQLGLGDGKGPQVEKCRERLVCLMYANPAKYAPYSNLVSAQLSRELNELRKPSSDNPEILRFFRYMKAAKNGQDGEACYAHTGCPSLQTEKPSPAMLTTFNDINKLVQARKFH